MTEDQLKDGRDCEALRPLIPACARGDLEAAQEEALLEHAASCASCRAGLAAADPAALFMELRGQALPGGFWQGFDQSLRKRLEAERQEGFWPRAWEALGSFVRPPRLAYFAAPVVIVFLLGVTMVVTRPGALLIGPLAHRPESGVRSPYVTPVVPRQAPPGERAGGAPLSLQAMASRGATLEPPPLEEVRSPAARIYRLDLAGQDPTPIYMVVDETIEF